MVKIFHFFLISFSLLGLISCASSGRVQQIQLKNLVQAGHYDQALKLLEKEKFFQKKIVHPLKLMEKGLILHRKGNYLRSSQVIEEALRVVGELYTIRLKGKLEEYFKNDNADIYYGEKYEVSSLHFYQTLNYFLLYQNSLDLPISKRREYLYKARAQLVAWDQFIREMQQVRAGQVVFKDDLMAKILGQFIHLAIDTSEDRQISKVLVKNSNVLLRQNYNAYPSFNAKWEKFNADFEKLPKLPRKKLESDYIESTLYQKELKAVLKELPLKTKKSQVQLAFLLEEGWIPPKTAKEHYYGLGKLYEKRTGPSLDILGFFAANILKLTPAPGDYSPGKYFVGHAIGQTMVQQLSVEFELPEIQALPLRSVYSVRILDDKGKEEFTAPFALINPLGELASQAVKEHSGEVYLRQGLRLGSKHLTALITSYLTYQGLKKKDAFVARTSAYLQYLALTKAIKASEKADTRYVSTLPQSQRMAFSCVSAGKKTIQVLLRSIDQEKGSVIKEWTEEFSSEQNTRLITLKL